ncbi:hypothetical protein [Aureimonas mangrovi]|uniref:hypothetical protein n=1 Tax=Aureimonas mangrovi TaxID=2758041 RepID=UPI00163DA3B1|nr:hypothetical protein [Aureimonas mangrovi]
MPAKTLYIVQQFERRGKKLVARRPRVVPRQACVAHARLRWSSPSAQAAVARAERDAERIAGVVAITQTVDTDTGEVLEESAALARHGELPAGVFGEE